MPYLSLRLNHIREIRCPGCGQSLAPEHVQVYRDHLLCTMCSQALTDRTLTCIVAYANSAWASGMFSIDRGLIMYTPPAHIPYGTGIVALHPNACARLLPVLTDPSPTDGIDDDESDQT